MALLFRLTRPWNGKPIAHLCPGHIYDIEVAGTAAAAGACTHLTTNQGTLQPAQPWRNSSKTSRVRRHRKETEPSTCEAIWKLVITCSVTGRVTLSAVSKRQGAPLSASLTLRVLQACAAAACRANERQGSQPQGAPARLAQPPWTRRALQINSSTTANSGAGSTGGTSAAGSEGDAVRNATGALAAALPELAELIAAMAKVAVQAPRACPPSSLGYTCSHAVSPSLTLHWTLGGPPPDNPCTRASTLRTFPPNPTQPHLHIAATAPTTSYLALAFSRSPRTMTNSDASIASPHLNGTFHAASYHIRVHALRPSDLYPLDRDWPTLAGVSLTTRTLPKPYRLLPDAPATDTTLCISRPLHAPHARATPRLHPRKLVSMLWALGRPGVAAGQLRYHLEAGGFTVDLRTGRLVVFQKRAWWVVHGVSTTLACCVLVPLSMALARHKWLLEGRLVGKYPAWLAWHVGLQAASLLLFVGASVLGLTEMAGGSGPLQSGHLWLGISLIVLLGTQLLAGTARPAPTARLRPAWLALHRATALALALGGFLECFLGVLIRRRKADEPHLAWMALLGGALVACLVGDALLSLLRRHSLEAAAAAAVAAGGGGPSTPTSLQAAADKKHTPQKALPPADGLLKSGGGAGDFEEGDWALSVESSPEKLRFVGGLKLTGAYSRFIPVPPLVVEGRWEGDSKGSPNGTSEGQPSSSVALGSGHSLR